MHDAVAPSTVALPTDLTGPVGARVRDLTRLLDIAAHGTDADRDRISTLLADCVVLWLRTASADALHEDGAALDAWLASETALALRARDADTFGRWGGFAEVLMAAAQRTDVAAAESIVRSHPKYGEKLLRLLAGAPGGTIPRAELLARLDKIPDAQLSRLLREFEAAEIVSRRTDGRSVTVSLGYAGRALVASPAFAARAETDRRKRSDQFVERESESRSSFGEQRPMFDDPDARDRAPVESFAGAPRDDTP